MERTPLLPLPEGLWIEQIQLAETGLTLTVIATSPTSCCPLCSEQSSSVHSHYQRTVWDVPCGGRQVQLVLRVRRFYCRNSACQRKVFTERLPTLVEPWARMTIRLCQALQAIGLATCGKGGARLAARLGIRTSRQTILRRIMELPTPVSPPCAIWGSTSLPSEAAAGSARSWSISSATVSLISCQIARPTRPSSGCASTLPFERSAGTEVESMPKQRDWARHRPCRSPIASIL